MFSFEQITFETERYHRYLVIDQTLPSLISRPPVTKSNIDFCTELGCIRLASAEDYDKLLDLLSVNINHL